MLFRKAYQQENKDNCPVSFKLNTTLSYNNVTQAEGRLKLPYNARMPNNAPCFNLCILKYMSIIYNIYVYILQIYIKIDSVTVAI